MTVSILQDMISGSRDGTPTAFAPSNTTVTLKAVMSEESARDTVNKFTMYLLARYTENGDWIIERKATWQGNPADDPFNPGHPGFPLVVASFPSSKPVQVNSRLEIGDGIAMSVGTNVTIV